MYVTHRRDCDTVGRVHAEVFGAYPPVATMVIVAGLLHPDMRVEIEVEAVLPEPGADG
jgi:enamine deaminase RidA (YjgF/YER057c/UK114 family)